MAEIFLCMYVCVCVSGVRCVGRIEMHCRRTCLLNDRSRTRRERHTSPSRWRTGGQRRHRIDVESFLSRRSRPVRRPSPLRSRQVAPRDSKVSATGRQASHRHFFSFLCAPQRKIRRCKEASAPPTFFCTASVFSCVLLCVCAMCKNGRER